MIKVVKVHPWLRGLAAALIVAASIGPSAHAATTWDVESDFSVANGNPNNLSGPRSGSSWSYGTFSRLAGLTEPDPSTFTLFTAVNPPFQTGLGLDAWSAGGTDPNISHNPTGEDIGCCGTIVWSPNEISISPAGASFVGARWTASSAGSYGVVTTFNNNQGASAPVYVYHGATVLFNDETGTPVGAGVTYSGTVTIANAGETIDFIAGSSQNTGLHALITLEQSIPNPFVTSTSPTGKTVRTNAVITIQIEDGQSQLAPATIQLYLNNAAVTPTITKPAASNVTTVAYDPKGALIQEATNTVRIVFGDNSTTPIVQTNNFSFWVISDLKAGNIVNLDLNGARNTPGVNELGGTFIGQGAAGGGETFNGLTADSRLPDGSDDDSLTVNGADLLDSLGQPTTLSFTLTPVGGRNDGASTSGIGAGALFNDYVFVGNFGQTSAMADFTLSGLGAIPSVDLYFYRGPGSPSQPIQIAGSTPAVLIGSGNFTSANTIFFSHVPVVGGRITGTLAGANASIAGLTVVKPLPQPYVQSVAPTGRGVKADSAITIELYDYVTTVAPATIQLSLNGQALTPTINKPVGSQVTTITYLPSGGWPSLSTNTVNIVFSDNSIPPSVQSAQFTFVVERISTRLTWVASEDYSLVSNPNGVWSYGSLPRTGDDLPDVASFAPYTDGTHGDIGTPLDFWHTGAIDPNVTHNPTASDYSNFDITWSPGEISLGPGFGGTLTGVRWTAPSADLYSVMATFSDNQAGGDGADVYVYQNDLPIFIGDAGIEIGAGVTFTTNLVLAAGDRLDFLVGAGPDVGPTGNNTALDAIVEMLPKAPLVTSTSPTGKAVRTNAVITLQIRDTFTQLAPATIQLFLNNAAVTPTITKPDGTNVTTVAYDPKGALIQEATNTVRIVFGDNSTPPIVQTNNFNFWVISDLKAGNIVNLDLNGARNTPGVNELGGTFIGQGAAGGGETFNGLTADSRLPDGSDDDSLTVSGADLLDSLGQPTTLSFTLTPVGGRNDGASTSGIGAGALFNDYVFVGNFGQTSAMADFSISGLGAIPSVDLYFYRGPGSPSQPIQIAGSTPAVLIGSGNFTSANTIFFSHVPVVGGRITGTLAGANASIAGLSVMKLLPATELRLSITRQANDVVISWTGPAKLQTADTVVGPWNDVAGATSPRTETPSASRKFYRLRQ